MRIRGCASHKSKMTEQEAFIALNMIPDVGSVRLNNLLEAFGSAAKIFLNSETKLKKVQNIGSKIAEAIASFAFERLVKELDLCKNLGIKIISLNDKEYPENLKNIYGPPLCLYVKGELLPSDKLSLAIVGSRRASFYGLSCAEKFSYELADLGITIISGLARGIDTYAHKGALKARGRTLAVLGSGLNCVYPPENKRLSEDIAKIGAVISEFPFNTQPLAQNFPRRNRIISGLSLAVIVVEAARNSGALITSDFALEQGRDVFAVPGEVSSATSFGTNQLIKQGAKLIDSVEDILEELKPELKEFTKAQTLTYSVERLPRQRRGIADRKADLCAKRSFASAQKSASICENKLSDEERLVYNLLTDTPRYVDDIIEEVGLGSAKIMSILLKLEINRLIRQLPGKMFIRSGKL